jgi:hypothetical protein
MIGFVFPVEGDARNFYKQVYNRKEIKRTSFAELWHYLLIPMSCSKCKGCSTRKEEEYDERRFDRQIPYLRPGRGIFRARRPYGL